MSLPPEIQVHATNERVIYRLPRRRVFRETPGCVVWLVGLSFLLLLSYGALVVGSFEKHWMSGLLSAVFASPLALLGFLGVFLTVWVTLGGRSEIVLSRGRLLLRERAGPLVVRRSFDPLRIVRFRVHPLERGDGALDLDILGGGSRRWAVDYPVPLLEELASDLARRKDEILKASPPGPAEVEIVDGFPRVTVRPTFRQTWLAPLFPLGWVCLTLLLGAGLKLAVEEAREHLVAAGGLLGIVWVGGTLAALLGYRTCRKTVVFESSGKTLRARERDFLGRRVREWARADVWGFEVEQGRLQVRLANGKRETVLSGRDGPTLEWIAGILRRGAPRKEVEVLSTTTSKGTCQV
ncbi:MAG TPA: hypothetical protein VF950_08080, partial [Planctomycetota bacterium]